MTNLPPWRYTPDQISPQLARDLAQIGHRQDTAKLDAIRALLKALPPRPAHGGSKTLESAALAGIHLILEDKS